MSGPVVTAVRRAVSGGHPDGWTLYLRPGPLHTAFSCDKWHAQAPQLPDFWLMREAIHCGARTALAYREHEI